VTLWCAALAGACAAFLWFNGHPASVFLGDVGALGLGGALGTAALLSHQALALLVVGGVFVAEAGSVMLQVASYRWRNGRRIFRVAPLHHHVELGGVAETHVVTRFWIVGLLLAASGLVLFWRA
jgi:phospho-N-acetylmuramoyl-pentapeptide-transferase